MVLVPHWARNCATAATLPHGTVATVVLGWVLQPVASLIVGGNVIGTVLFAAALLVFAFGVRGSGSVTARRPLGTTAIVVLAGWMIVAAALKSFVFTGDFPVDGLLVFGYVDAFVQFVAALVAVVQVGRAGVVPRPWNWASAWVLLAIVVAWLLGEGAAMSATGSAQLANVVVTVDGLVHLGGVVFLGVIAIVLATRLSRPKTVRVFPGTD